MPILISLQLARDLTRSSTLCLLLTPDESPHFLFIAAVLSVMVAHDHLSMCSKVAG